MSLSGEALESEYVDDPSISDETLLYRRVLKKSDPPVRQIIWDGINKCWRPSSAAFSDHKNGSPMSVGLGDALEQHGLTPDSLLAGHEDFALVCFEAKVVRSKGLGIIRRPIPPKELAHGEVFGKKTKGVKNALVNNSAWHGDPELPPPPSEI